MSKARSFSIPSFIKKLRKTAPICIDNFKKGKILCVHNIIYYSVLKPLHLPTSRGRGMGMTRSLYPNKSKVCKIFKDQKPIAGT